MNPQKLRKDFPGLKQKVNGERLVYLDNAATSQKPESVIQEIQKFYRKNNANIGRSLHSLGNKATQEYEDSRKKTAEFINASSEEIIFTRNTTESLNLLAQSLELDGKILAPDFSHHSEQLPFRREARNKDIEFDFIPSENGKIDIESAKEMIDEETSLISVPQISNVYGKENPIKELTEIAHSKNAYIVVDGAQSVPRMPVDVKNLDIDFLAFSGHKMLGPTGIGVLYGKRNLLEQLKPYQVGGGMIRTVKRDKIQWKEPPGKFEAGTPNIAGSIGLKQAISYLENIGLKEIYRHEKKLTNQIIERLQEIEEVSVHSPKDSTIASFTMEKAHPHDISEILDRNGVAIRAGHHCAQPLMDKIGVAATARASPYLYNTEKDVEQFINGVKEVRRVFK